MTNRLACLSALATALAVSPFVLAQRANLPPPQLGLPTASIQAQTAIPESTVPSLTVRFQGGDVPSNAARVLQLLQRQGVLTTKAATIGKGQSVCDTYLEVMGFPSGCTQQLVGLADDLNGIKFQKKTLQVGDIVSVPDVYFLQTPFTKRFDPTVPDDQKALDDVRKNWGPYIVSESKLSTGLVRVSLMGFELKVPISSGEDAQRIVATLTAAHIPNVYFTHPAEQKRLQKYHMISPSKYVSDCQANVLPAGEQCAYSLLLGLDKLDWAACNTRCPDVFLLDKPVSKNPALGFVLDGSIDDADSPPAAATSCTLPPLKEADHGTHLASVIGSAGPACIGLYPGVRLHSWNREADATVTRDDIERAQSHYDENSATVGLPIFVFASSWEFSGKRGQLGERLPDRGDHCENPAPCERYANPIAAEIADNKSALWIVAAGQPDVTKNERAVEITADLALGPMNLGNLPNVLVITGCLDCASDHPTLRNPVNYSRAFVHVAAPGDDIPGIAGTRRLAVGGGTSQAVAFGAGVASAMVAKYPDSFRTPQAVKTRLQVTSRPLFAGPDASRLATGVVDPAVALKAPDKDYWQPIGGSLVEAKIDNWCVKELQLSDPATLGALPPLATKHILRMYRVNRDDSTAQPQWIFYTKVPYLNGTKSGEVLRIGPAVVSLPGPRPGQGGSLFKMQGSGVSPGRFVDLVVHDPVSLGGPSCG